MKYPAVKVCLNRLEPPTSVFQLTPMDLLWSILWPDPWAMTRVRANFQAHE